jgi:hypothetical protein
MDSTASGWGSALGSCEHGNEHSDLIKEGDFLKAE